MIALIALCILFFPPASAAPSRAPDALSAMMEELKRKPEDSALREKIIRHVRGMKKPPALPEDAERFIARGAAAMGEAKQASDYDAAVAEFAKATLAAPWHADGYFNMAVASEKAGALGSAIANFKLYLAAAPNASDAKAIKQLIYKLEFHHEKAEAERKAAGDQAKKAGDAAERERNLMLGRWNCVELTEHYEREGDFRRPFDAVGTLDGGTLVLAPHLQASIVGNSVQDWQCTCIHQNCGSTPRAYAPTEARVTLDRIYVSCPVGIMPDGRRIDEGHYRYECTR